MITNEKSVMRGSRADDNAEEVPVDPGDDDTYCRSLAAPEVRSDDIPFISKFLGLILYRLSGGFFYVWIPSKGS